jgi:hypothetical protein
MTLLEASPDVGNGVVAPLNQTLHDSVYPSITVVNESHGNGIGRPSRTPLAQAKHPARRPPSLVAPFDERPRYTHVLCTFVRHDSV